MLGICFFQSPVTVNMEEFPQLLTVAYGFVLPIENIITATSSRHQVKTSDLLLVRRADCRLRRTCLLDA